MMTVKECDAMYSSRSSPTFQRNILPPSSGPKVNHNYWVLLQTCRQIFMEFPFSPISYATVYIWLRLKCKLFCNLSVPLPEFV